MSDMTPIEVLKELEWIGLNGCVYCGRTPDNGHKDNCIVGNAIREYDEKEHNDFCCEICGAPGHNISEIQRVLCGEHDEEYRRQLQRE